jgi:hypothetical protein
VEGSQLLAAIRQMPRLNLLDVSACRKLTSDFVDPAFSMMQPPEGSGPGMPISACIVHIPVGMLT